MVEICYAVGLFLFQMDWESCWIAWYFKVGIKIKMSQK